MPQQKGRPQGKTFNQVESGNSGGDLLCTCCTPPNPLVLRPDLGCLADGSAAYALCVLHQPDPVVYRNRGDGTYERASHLALNARGEIVDAQGRAVARVQQASFQRLTTLDDEESPPPPG